MKDLYKILNLNKNCTPDDIRKSYKSLVLIYHPDKNSKNLHYNDLKFKDIIEAYSILSNETKKKIYDSEEFPQDINRCTQNFNDYREDLNESAEKFNENLDNIFNNFFDSDINSNIFNSFDKKDKFNIDIIQKLEINLDTAYTGGKYSVSIIYRVNCNCKNYSSNDKICTYCKDTGFIKVLKQINATEISEIYKKCDKCNIHNCSVCNNMKYINKKKNLKVNIPKYTKNKDEIVIKNGGHQDLETRNFGNLYIHMKLLNDKLYKFAKNDIILKKHIHLYDILMKTNILFDFLDKKKYYFGLTEIINPYTNIIIKGWGLFNYKTNVFGDLVIKFHIKFPKNINLVGIEKLFSKIKNSQNNIEDSNKIDESLIIYSKCKNIF